MKEKKEQGHGAQSKETSESFLSRKTLCQRWEVSIDFLRSLEEEGVLKPMKLSPKCVRYRLSEVEEIERANTRENAMIGG